MAWDVKEMCMHDDAHFLVIYRCVWGYRLISEKATVEPQFRSTSLEDEYTIMQPTYANTLLGTTSMVTPIAKSTPMTQAS